MHMAHHDYDVAVSWNRYVQCALFVVYVLYNMYTFWPTWRKREGMLHRLDKGDPDFNVGDGSTFGESHWFGETGGNLATPPVVPTPVRTDSLPTVPDEAWYFTWPELMTGRANIRSQAISKAVQATRS